MIDQVTLQQEADYMAAFTAEGLEALDRVLAGWGTRVGNDWNDDCVRAGVHHLITEGGERALQSWLSNGRSVQAAGGTVVVENLGSNLLGAYTTRVARNKGTKTVVEVTVTIEGEYGTATATKRLSLKRLAAALDDLGEKFDGQHLLFVRNA